MSNWKDLMSWAVEIAEESTNFDNECREWRGHDTNMGNLPMRIKEHLNKILSVQKAELKKKLLEKQHTLANSKTIVIGRKEFDEVFKEGWE